MLLATSTALATNGRNYRVLRRFVIWLNTLVTIVAILVASTPLFDLIVRRIMGIPRSDRGCRSTRADHNDRLVGGHRFQKIRPGRPHPAWPDALGRLRHGVAAFLERRHRDSARGSYVIARCLHRKHRADGRCHHGSAVRGICGAADNPPGSGQAGASPPPTPISFTDVLKISHSAGRNLASHAPRPASRGGRTGPHAPSDGRRWRHGR